ncbi:MAG: DUF4355 domain-containing protein [Clostridia bacterium]|nr:DUF4355 domain-containing protein [Clostridia bacterium]
MAETEKNMDTTNVTGEETGNEAAEEKGRVYTQADIDALIEKRLAREKRDQEKRLQEARTAGEKAGEARARMSEEERLRSDRERAEQEAGEREAQLRQREQELVSRELRIDALDGDITIDSDAGVAYTVENGEKVWAGELSRLTAPMIR